MSLFPDARARGLAMAIPVLLASAALSISAVGAKDFARASRERVVEEIEAPGSRSYEEIITQLPPLVRRKASPVKNAKQGESGPVEPVVPPPPSIPAVSPEAVAKAQDAPLSAAPPQQAGGEAAIPQDANAAAPAEAKPASAPVADGAEQSAEPPAPASGAAPSIAAPVAIDARPASAPAPQAAPPSDEGPAISPEQPVAAAQSERSPDANVDAASRQAPQANTPAPLPEIAEPAANAPAIEQPAPDVGAASAEGDAPAPVAQAEKPAPGETAHPAGKGAALVRLAGGLAAIGILAFWLLRKKAGARAPKTAAGESAVGASKNQDGAKAAIWAKISADLQARFRHGARANGGVAQSARTSPEGDGAPDAPAAIASRARALLRRPPAASAGKPAMNAAPASSLDAGAAANAREIEQWLGVGSDSVELLEPKRGGASAVVAKTRRSLRNARA